MAFAWVSGIACRFLRAARDFVRCEPRQEPPRPREPPIVGYLRKLEDQNRECRLVALIAELTPIRPWEWFLHNQRGVVLRGLPKS